MILGGFINTSNYVTLAIPEVTPYDVGIRIYSH